MTTALIVAASTNNVIGVDNQLPWHLPNDLKYFKNLTWAMPVIMGRRTFESLGKALSGRLNIVITSNGSAQFENAVAVKSVKDALFVAGEADYNTAFIIGGGQIFRETLPKADILYLTRVHVNIEGDVFFPELDKHWQLVWNEDHFRDEKHAYDYSFQRWERR
ncbi:MAG TPA: dihydrofolate reductase [Chitinophagaceae bacterium]